MILNVNQKGVIGLAKVTADLVCRQYEVFIPTSDACPIDLIVADGAMRLKRVQVKYREPTEERGTAPKVLSVSLDSVVNGRRIPVDTSQVDVWAIYCPQTDDVYYVLREEVSKKSIRLCLEDAKGRRNRLASEYRDPARIFSGS